MATSRERTLAIYRGVAAIVLPYLKAQGRARMDDLESLCKPAGYTTTDVREAVWDLIDKGRIRLPWSRALEYVPWGGLKKKEDGSNE